MHKILVTGKKFSGELLFELDQDGVVRSFINDADLNVDQVKWLSTNFPMHLDKLNEMISQGMITGKLIEADLSFENFWSKYDYKVGKQQSQRFWDKLSKEDKLLALDNIDPYNYYLSIKTNQDRMYPASYLNPANRKFEDDYRALIKSNK